jgi:tetratricopeptide (TPR) repeat protein
MDNTEYIVNYFNSINTDKQKQQFEEKILKDRSFAAEVAFYISANKLIKQKLNEEKKQRFREIYDEQNLLPINPPVKNISRYLIAASIIFIFILSALFVNKSKTSPPQLADKYIEQNWKTLAVNMGGQDSIETGLSLYNSGKLATALIMFEMIAKNNTANNTNAKKYAGIVSLRLKNYDKAIEYFSMLEADTSLHSNPGKFFEAITLMKRDKEGDREKAKLLLQELISKDLEGKFEAQKWVEKL